AGDRGHVRYPAAELAGVRRAAVRIRDARAVQVRDARLVARRGDERAGVAARVGPGVLERAAGRRVAVRVENRAADAHGVWVVGRVLGERHHVVADAVRARVDDRARRAGVARRGEQRAALHHDLLEELGLRGLR